MGDLDDIYEANSKFLRCTFENGLQKVIFHFIDFLFVIFDGSFFLKYIQIQADQTK